MRMDYRGLIPLALLCLSLGAVAAPATEPAAAGSVGPVTEQVKGLRGKTVYFTNELDPLGTGEANPGAFDYLSALLEQNGARARPWRDSEALHEGDVLVLGEPNVPVFSMQELDDPLNAARRQAALKALGEYPEMRARLVAAAKAARASVVEEADAARFFGVSRESTVAMKRFAFGRLAEALRRQLPELNFPGTALVDTIDFLRDVTGQRILVDWDALEKAGVARDKLIQLQARNIPLDQALGALVKQAGLDKLGVYVDESVLVLTSIETATKRRARRAGSLLTIAELNNPPAAALQPPPDLPPALLKPIPALTFSSNDLADVVDFLKDVTGQNIVADWDALAAAKITRDTLVTMRVHRLPAHRVLAYVSSAVSEDDVVFYLSTSGVVRLTTRDAAGKAADKVTTFER